MTSWNQIAILPNLSINEPIEGGYAAFASLDDPRIRSVCQSTPKLAEFLSRFTDAFANPLKPTVLIARDDAQLSADSLLSFRDLVAISVIPYSRSLNTVYRTKGRAVYSNSFWIYPWTFRGDGDLETATPSFTGRNVVEKFQGQSSPEVWVLPEIRDLDTPLFEALLARWKRHYFGKRPRWVDRALFRSLDMAFHAASLPAGIGTSIFDLGRSVSLWVSAFETLSHPRVKRADLFTVYSLFEGVTYCNNKVGRKQYAAYTPPGTKKGTQISRRPLPCWIYGELYQARNKFLHGNRVTVKALNPTGSKEGLFWLAPSLYRLALSGFLKLVVHKNLPSRLYSNEYGKSAASRKKQEMYDRQHMIERALLRIRD